VTNTLAKRLPWAKTTSLKIDGTVSFLFARDGLEALALLDQNRDVDNRPRNYSRSAQWTFSDAGGRGFEFPHREPNPLVAAGHGVERSAIPIAAITVASP
jgi:hypothetical protein